MPSATCDDLAIGISNLLTGRLFLNYPVSYGLFYMETRPKDIIHVVTIGNSLDSPDADLTLTFPKL